LDDFTPIISHDYRLLLVTKQAVRQLIQ